MQNEMMIINRKDYEDCTTYEDFFKALDEFPFDQFDFDLEYKVQNMALILNELYKKLKKELSGTFTLNEAWLIIETFNGHLYTPKLDDKNVLIQNIIDGIEFMGLDLMFEVDKDKLLGKIELLSEIDAFIVIRMAYEFWNYNRKNPVHDNEAVKRIFMITA